MEVIKPTLKQFIYIIEYNSNFNFDSNNNIKFVYINLFCNKLSIQLLTNNFIIYIKKKGILKTKYKANKSLKVKVT